MSLRTSNDRAWEPTEDWQFMDMTIDDLVDVVYDMDENEVRKLLLLIVNEAMMLKQLGNRDLQMRFVDDTCKRIEPLAWKWAEEKAELARERGDMS